MAARGGRGQAPSSRGRFQSARPSPTTRRPKSERAALAAKIADAGGMTGYLIGSLVGPLHADMAMMEGELRAQRAGKTLENKLLRTDDIKSVLPRGSSALVLIAAPEINDQLVSLFDKWSPEVIRRDVAQEVQKRLETFKRKTQKDIAEQRAAAN